MAGTGTTSKNTDLKKIHLHRALYYKRTAVTAETLLLWSGLGNANHLTN